MPEGLLKGLRKWDIFYNLLNENDESFNYDNTGNSFITDGKIIGMPLPLFHPATLDAEH